MKVTIHYNQKLSVDIEGPDEEKEIVELFCRQVRAQQEQIEARIMKGVQDAVLAALPNFDAKRMDMTFEE